jgi:hypothetical protein
MHAERKLPITAMRVNNPDRSPVLRDPHLNPQVGLATGEERREADAKAPVRVEFRMHSIQLNPLIIETRSLPGLTRSYPRRFTFYVAPPARCIPKFTEPEKTFLCMDLL